MSDIGLDNEKTMRFEDAGVIPQDYISGIMDQFGSVSTHNQKEEDEIKRDKKFSTAIKIIIGILLTLGVLEVVFCKIVIPSIASPLVSVTGAKAYSPQEIVDMLRIMNVSNWVSFNPQQAALIISSASGIEDVSIKKTFPNKIYINIVERTPVALTFVNIDHKSIALQIDKNGVLFSDKNFKADKNLPIISGLPINHLSEGMRIGETYRVLIDQIAAITALKQNYFAAVSEICVVPKEGGNYELNLIPAKSKIRVITDRALTEDTLKYMVVALDIISNIDPDARVLNMKGGVISYTH